MLNIGIHRHFIVVLVFNLQPPGLPLLPTPTTIPSGRSQYRTENKHTNNQVCGLSLSFQVSFSCGFSVKFTAGLFESQLNHSVC